MKKVLKKSMAVIMAALMIAGMAIAGLPAQEVDAAAPYLILNASGFNKIRNNLSAKYVLGADIDLSGYPQWQKIGTSSACAFKGEIEGNGYTISGLSFGSKSEADYGLFGYTNGATIKNLNIKLAKGTSTGASCSRKGVLAGSLYNTKVDNVHINGNGGTVQGADYSGGFAGVLSGSVVTNSSVENIKVISKCNYAGGFIGASSLDACGSKGAVNTLESNNVKDVVVSAGSSNAGGFVGYTNGPSGTTKYKECHVENADVTAACSYVGGFAGKVYLSHSFDSCTVKNIKAKSTKGSYVGGFVGHAYACGTQTQTMVDCRVLGASVSAVNTVGGFAGMYGYTTSGTSIVNKAVSCYAIDVDVSASGGCAANAGGWAGKIWRSQVSESCAMGTTVKASSSGYNVGGFVGEMAYNASTTDCYAEFESVSGMKWVGGFCGYLSACGTNTIKNTYGVAKINTTYKAPASGSHTGYACGGTFQGTNYFDNQVSNLGAAGTTYKGHIQGYNTATMMKQATFVGWDFVNIWRIDENETYPYFWKQAKPVTAAPGIKQGYAGDNSVSGTGIPGAVITVTTDGKDYTTTVNPDNSWTVTIDVPLVKDQVVKATQKEEDKRTSEASEMTVHAFDISVRGVPYDAVNLTSGSSTAVAGDKIRVTGTAVAGSTRWMSATITISLANRVNIDESTIIVGGNAGISGSDYVYNASTQRLTLYLGRINAGNTVDFSFDVNIAGSFGADLKDTIMTLTH